MTDQQYIQTIFIALLTVKQVSKAMEAWVLEINLLKEEKIV